ncbi:MTG1 [Acanthosepion pharaonis]|uniref:Mitochondrial GTPase 1 n=1 Tax=Acanthosepion pharaonis TaxID=158019 RepID=A0A812CWS9_ACAPH|nr:MTG1 [Sepia pharaonis]
MHKGMQQMMTRLKKVDCVIEIRDARIPISGNNPKFAGLLRARPHLLILNKADLCDMSHKESVLEELHKDGIQEVLWTNCKEQYKKTELSVYNVMVIGIPNIGKSSFINAVRRTHVQKGSATAVGAKAGITRSVIEKIKVSANPKIYVYDTPGVLAPEVKNISVGMKLALCSCLQDHLVGEDIIVDYMLFWLNRHQKFQYVTEFELEEPTDDILFLLNHVAKKNNKYIKHRSLDSNQGRIVYRPDFTAAANIILQKFRAGDFGPVMLDAKINN